MYIIKLVNENEGKQYDEQGLLSLLSYIYRPAKTQTDLFRPDTLHGYPCVGCEPFIFPKEYEQDPEVVFEYMCFNNHAFGIVNGDLARHRIISFDAAADLLPRDLDPLGRRITQFYASEGYIAAYGVHADTSKLHIHIVVDTVSYMNGNRFSISFEFNNLKNIVSLWEAKLYTQLVSNEKRMEQREALLYGQPHYGQIPLSVEEQIKLHSRM